jgi:hypothetical protein
MNASIRPRTLAIYARTSKEYKCVERVAIRQQVEVAQRLASTKGYSNTLVFADPDRCCLFQCVTSRSPILIRSGLQTPRARRVRIPGIRIQD